jgi:hypothetical protein
MCYEPLISDLSVISPCGHIFHNDCISKYINSKDKEKNTVDPIGITFNNLPIDEFEHYSSDEEEISVHIES